MTAATSGQAARNAWFKARYHQFPPPGSWRDLPDSSRREWEDIARAAIDADPDRRALYRERAQLAAYLAAAYPSVIASAPDAEGWAIVYVDTPAGQMSWHIALADTDLFAHLPQHDDVTWDGHSTEEKYERLGQLTRNVAAQQPQRRDGLLPPPRPGAVYTPDGKYEIPQP